MYRQGVTSLDRRGFVCDDGVQRDGDVVGGNVVLHPAQKARKFA